jgi:type VI secretion system protein VasG
LLDEIAGRCTEVESGARNVDNILSNTLLPELSRQLLGRMAEEQPVQRVLVELAPDGNFQYSW